MLAAAAFSQRTTERVRRLEVRRFFFTEGGGVLVLQTTVPAVVYGHPDRGARVDFWFAFVFREDGARLGVLGRSLSLWRCAGCLGNARPSTRVFFLALRLVGCGRLFVVQWRVFIGNVPAAFRLSCWHPRVTRAGCVGNLKDATASASIYPFPWRHRKHWFRQFNCRTCSDPETPASVSHCTWSSWTLDTPNMCLATMRVAQNPFFTRGFADARLEKFRPRKMNGKSCSLIYRFYLPATNTNSRADP